MVIPVLVLALVVMVAAMWARRRRGPGYANLEGLLVRRDAVVLSPDACETVCGFSARGPVAVAGTYPMGVVAFDRSDLWVGVSGNGFHMTRASTSDVSLSSGRLHQTMDLVVNDLTVKIVTYGRKALLIDRARALGWVDSAEAI